MAGSTSRRSNQLRNTGSYAEDASKLIRENMKCPVCLEVLLPPIYQCETGHNICYLCVDEVTECPLCKSDYGDTRNYFAEELVNSMTFPCKYEEYGCHKTFLGSQLKDHQENCECQPYRCPELACQEVVGIHQMAKHLDKHGFKVMQGDAHQASLEILDDHFDRKTEYNPWRISAFGIEFYTVSTRSRDGLWYFWAYGLGVQKELRKFSYEVVLYSDEKQIMYRGVIQSLRHNPEDVMKNGNCLITTDQVIKSIRKNGRIKCQVYFIQGKNWDSTRNSVFCEKRKIKHAKVKSKKVKGSGAKGSSKKSLPIQTNTVAYTCPLISNQASLVSQLTATSKNKSRGSVLGSHPKASPMDIPNRKESDSNGNKITSKSNSAKSGKGSKILSGLRPLSTNVVTTDAENSFVEQVRNTLRCPSCNEVISPPVYQCLIGHNVCHKCKMTRQDCSLCLSPLTDCRNFFAEELLYKTFQRCLYSKHGCKVCLPSAQMKSHEAVCDFAPFECPFNVCRTLLRSDDLLEHMKTHQVATVEKELKNEVFVPRNFPKSSVSIIPNILMVEKVPFYPIIVRDSDGNWLFYVITHNYPKYRFEFIIKKQSKTFAFQGPVLSLRSTHSQIKLKGNALVLTERSVKSLKVHDKLVYQIKITKIESYEAGNERTLSLPASWVLTPRSGEIVSRTELFANKKTSVSPKDESEDEDDETSSVARNERETSDTDNEDSEVMSLSELSLVTTTQEDERESEVETRPKRRPKSRESSSYCTMRRTSSREDSIVPRLSDSSMSSKTGKNAILPELPALEPIRVEEQLPKRNASSSIVRSKDCGNGICRGFTVDRNNNVENIPSHRRSRRGSLSTDSLTVVAPGSPNAACDGYDDYDNTACKAPISILKYSETALQRAGNNTSMHNLKIAGNNLLSPKSSVVSSPLMMQRAFQKKSKRSRSPSRHRVRLSDQVICCGADEELKEDINGNHVCTKSHSSLRLSSSSKTSIRTVPSKHVLTVQIREDANTIKADDESDDDTKVEELKKAANMTMADTQASMLMDEEDLLSVKGFNDVTEAVISGGFDVVKSVISLFTSDATEDVKESSEELGSKNFHAKGSKSKSK